MNCVHHIKPYPFRKSRSLALLLLDSQPLEQAHSKAPHVSVLEKRWGEHQAPLSQGSSPRFGVYLLEQSV